MRCPPTPPDLPHADRANRRVPAAAWRRCLAAALAATVALGGAVTGRGADPPAGAVEDIEMAGYLLVPHEKVPDRFNAGFSMYVAAWPLLARYPGNRFQTGLFGTWMFAQYDGPKPPDLYSDIEGGLGWWRDTRFATETPKFIMGGVARNFSEWANGPGAGKSRDWDRPLGVYGVAQLSPWVLWPPDGLNLRQGTCGQWVGYGYLPLPLTPAKAVTAGAPVPTGGNCWTLFLNTGNFKGPVAFFTPFYWSRASVTEPSLAGMFLDSRPSHPNRALQMETQYVPAVRAADAAGAWYARIAPTSFPRDADGLSPVVHRVTAYDRTALWDAVERWFAGGPAASGRIAPEGAALHTFTGGGGSTWRISPPGTPRDDKVPLEWGSFATAEALDPHTYGYRWNRDLVSDTLDAPGPRVTLPEYYRLVERPDGKPRWQPVPAAAVPAETGLVTHRFVRPPATPPEPYVTPDDPGSCWRQPGPVAGPFTVRLGDGSVVTYHWYRFADQPALLNADLTAEEREALQARVERLHRHWRRDGEYLPAPGHGTLADLDPAVLVEPPPGLEVGYVPIVTRQAADGPSAAERR